MFFVDVKDKKHTSHPAKNIKIRQRKEAKSLRTQ